MKKIYLSLVIPACNEAERLPLTILAVENHLSRQPYQWELIVVDDGSTDNTSAFVERLRQSNKRIKLVRNETSEGKGSAVKKGMLIAEGKYRFFMDADNSTKIENLENLLPFLESDADGVIGSRYLKESKTETMPPRYSRFLSRAVNRIIHRAFLLGIKDARCGFKGFRGEVAEKVFNLARIGGSGFDIEILALMKHLGYRVKELPVVWKIQRPSHAKPFDYLRVLGETVKVKWWLRRGIYNAVKQN